MERSENEFLKLYNLYNNDVLRLAFSYLKNINDAEDVFQLVFFKLYKALENDNGKNFSKEWLIKVTINECKDFFKSSWVKKIIFKDTQELNIPYKEEKDDLLEEINKLPLKYRLIIYLYYYEGYNIREIASIMKEKPRNIQYSLQKAKEKLKYDLKEVLNYEK